ncbi:MAG: SMC-Scp complex subunit ScpB [bacterium]|nr:SMC-Scp complex subunit ScpB [bacterium]
MEEMETNNANNDIAKIEALLFAYGEPVTLKKLSLLTGLNAETVAAHLTELESRYNADSARGIALLRRDNETQLVTKTNLSALIETLVKSEVQEALTPAAEETLAIIGYGGPIGRAEIDYIRGVNSSFILRSLSLRGLIDRDVDPHRANAYRYSASFASLKHLGVGNARELPDYEKYRSLIEKFRNAGEAVKDTAHITPIINE